MSDSLHGHGATLLLGGTVATNCTAVGNIISIGGPEMSRDSLEISTMESAGKFREFIPGLLDAGEVTMEVNYDGTAAGTANFLQGRLTATLVPVPTNPTSQTLVVLRFYDHATAASRSNWVCPGLVTGLGHAIPFDDKVTQSVTVKLTGQPTYTDLT